MRRSGLAAVITGALLVVACSDQPTAPAERPTTPPAPSFSVACADPPSTTCIQGLIDALFRPGDNLKSANSFWNNIQTKVKQGTPKALADARAKATDLVNLGLKNFYANKLIGGMSAATGENLIALADAAYRFAGVTTNAPSIPPGALTADGAAAIITPGSPTTLVITGTKQAGILIPAGAAPTTTLVSIVRLPDSPGPLRTSLDQFPLFYHFASSPEVTFNVDVTGGICQSQTFDAETFAQLRLAHNVFPFGFGDVEILPRVNAPFLDCSNLAVGTLEHGGLIGFASAGWNFLGRTVGPVATAILLPDELHAAALETCCLGGTLKKFSEFGAVDPGSNPASLDYNPDAATFDDLSAPAGTAVTPAPSVVVKSQNGTPIANVPVEFAVGEGGGTVNGGSTATVFTDANGVATVTTWTLGIIAGTYTLTATPPAVEQVGTDEPFKPAVEFDPTSLEFTATATPGPAAAIAIHAGDAQTAPAGSAVATPPAVRVTDQYGNVVPGFTVTFSVTGGGGSITGATAVTDAGGVAAVGSWTIGQGTNTLDATAAGLSGSPVTFTATGLVAFTLYGVNSGDDGLSTINSLTGVVSFIGRLGGENVNLYTTPIAMAVRPSDGTLFVWNNSGDGTDEGASNGVLLTVNPTTGLGTPANPDTPDQGNLAALAFSPNGALFGVESELFTVNPATGVKSLVGSLGSSLRIGGADFSCSGLLFGVELTGGPERLVTINTATGLATVVATLSQDVGVIGSILFDPSGTLVGSSFGGSLGDVLFDINPVNGTVSNVRTIPGGATPQGMGIARTC
jgi:hypothetical protein